MNLSGTNTNEWQRYIIYSKLQYRLDQREDFKKSESMEGKNETVGNGL